MYFKTCGYQVFCGNADDNGEKNERHSFDMITFPMLILNLHIGQGNKHVIVICGDMHFSE